MDGVFEFQVKQSILSLKDNNFQAFIEKLLKTKYGLNFICVKQKRDKGCDGIINNLEVIAVYAPEKDSLNKFKKKVGEDHIAYAKNWKAKYPDWCCVYNGDFTADRIQFVDSLDENLGKWGIDNILEIFRNLNWPDKRELAGYLKIDENYFINDVLKNVVDDLINDRKHIEDRKTQKKPVFIEDKIKINFAKADVDSMLAEYDQAFPYLNELKGLLKAYSDGEVSTLKSRIIREYSNFSGIFKTRFNKLTELLSERNKGDDIYKFYVRVVLVYAFETCIIGKKAANEP